MLWIILIVVLVIVFWIISAYNGLVTLKQRVSNAWSQIDVQLQRRFDLIPNLVETVKGYAKHEKGTLEAVIKARNTFLSAKSPEDEMKASKEVSTALNKLFALAEAYPDLKANENFTSLQNTLSETEDKISYARQFYNDNVMNYKNKIEMFPSNIVAGIFNFKPEPFFEATEEERKNVEVKF